jgi:hypothetical protein
MRVVFGTICLLIAATPAMASVTPAAVPAPLLGVGLPAAMAVGGVLLVARLVKKMKR